MTMLTKPIRFIQIESTGDHILGLDRLGRIWYRDKLPYVNYNSTYTPPPDSAKEKEKKARGRIWKRMKMDAEVILEDNGPAVDVPQCQDEEIAKLGTNIELDEKALEAAEVIETTQQSINYDPDKYFH